MKTMAQPGETSVGTVACESGRASRRERFSRGERTVPDRMEADWSEPLRNALDAARMWRGSMASRGEPDEAILEGDVAEVFSVNTNMTQEDRIVFRIRMSNEPVLFAPLILLIERGLERYPSWSDRIPMQLGIAVQEALANAVYHGNLEVSSDLRQQDEAEFYALAEKRRRLAPYCDRQIHLSVEISAALVSFTIEDEGPGFDTAILDRPSSSDNLLRIGGRGLCMIRAYMDEVTLNAKGNRITMIKRAASR